MLLEKLSINMKEIKFGTTFFQTIDKTSSKCRNDLNLIILKKKSRRLPYILEDKETFQLRMEMH